MSIFQTVQVETHGKGKPYTRVEKVVTSLDWSTFRTKFAILFNDFSKHIIAAWLLTNTKVEMIKPLPRRSLVLFVTTDFAENILVIRKHELADQYFHRIEILLFGAVVSFVVKAPYEKEEEDCESGGGGLVSQASYRESNLEEQSLALHQRSYMVSSDYRSFSFVAIFTYHRFAG